MFTADEGLSAPPDEVAKGGAVATLEEDAKGMDVDVPMTEEVDVGDDDIPETQDDCFNLCNMEAIGGKEKELE